MFKLFCRSSLLLLGLSLTAQAAQPYGPTAEESKLLPAYCQGSAYWKSILGPDAGWNNHTCYGINRLNRYYKSRSARERKDHLQTALGDFSYSIAKLKPDFTLMPEIYMYRGITYRLMERNGAAVADLLKAISMDPKLTKAYNELADMYEGKFSQPAKALEIVTDGLRHNPETKSLQRRYTKLGGKLPYPEPLTQAEPAVTEPLSGAEQAAVPEVAPVVVPVEKTVTEPDSDKPKIGSPKNPYCRFCPD